MPQKNRKTLAGVKAGDHLRKEGREQGGENPVREAAQRLAFGPMPVGEDLGDEHPDHRPLADGVRRDEGEDASRDDAVDACVKNAQAVRPSERM